MPTLTRLARLLLSALLVLPLVLACETDTSPGEPGDNPPPPPTRTPNALRHGPNTGIYEMSNELSEEEAEKLGVKPDEQGPDDSAPNGESNSESSEEKEEDPKE